MLWPMIAIALAFCGVAVLGVLAIRVGIEVRRLARQVGEASEHILRAAQDLERSSAPLAGQASALRRD